MDLPSLDAAKERQRIETATRKLREFGFLELLYFWGAYPTNVSIASPVDLPSLDAAKERQRIETATRKLREFGFLELVWCPGQSWRELQQAMRSGPWHLFHFIGHGGFDFDLKEGVIFLVGEDGRSECLLASQVGRLLADHPSLRLVLLNSCAGASASRRDIFSSTAATLIRRGIPAVLAMQYEITDHAAIEFVDAFYRSVTDGFPVDAAVSEARKAVSIALTNSLEWGIPVLHMRSHDGVLFTLKAMSERGGRNETPYTRDQHDTPLQAIQDLVAQSAGLSEHSSTDHREGRGVFTGFASLDRLVGSLPRGGLITVGGRPNSGSVKLLLTIGLNTAIKYSGRVIVFCGDMTRLLHLEN